MIKNFDEVKQQLKELAEIVNSFKSEAVQLRLVELVFGKTVDAEPDEDISNGSSNETVKQRQPRRTRASKKPAAAGADVSPARAPRSGKLGARAALTRMLDDGFFKQPKTINDIVKHAEHNLATRLKQSDLSGPLARYVRDSRLTRAKNADKQYEYTQS